MERIRVRMLQNHDALFKGEHVNLPENIAANLIDMGKAEEVKAVAPSENKSGSKSTRKS